MTCLFTVRGLVCIGCVFSCAPVYAKGVNVPQDPCCTRKAREFISNFHVCVSDSCYILIICAQPAQATSKLITCVARREVDPTDLDALVGASVAVQTWRELPLRAAFKDSKICGLNQSVQDVRVGELIVGACVEHVSLELKDHRQA